MPLYTFVIDYRGGTYLAQVRARDIDTAQQMWAEKLDVDKIPYLGPRAKYFICNSMPDENCVPITGLKNTWCFSLIVRGALLLGHFIQTAET